MYDGNGGAKAEKRRATALYLQNPVVIGRVSGP